MGRRANETDGARHERLVREHERISRQLLLWARVSFVLVGTLPWWLPVMRRWMPEAPLWRLLDLLFVVVCHREPDRTLAIAGVPMPVCSRCGGIFAGLALGILIAWPRMSLRAARWAALGAGLLMLFDVLAQELAWHPFWHWTRLTTGIVLGYVLSAALVAAIVRERRAATPRPPPAWRVTGPAKAEQEQRVPAPAALDDPSEGPPSPRKASH